MQSPEGAKHTELPKEAPKNLLLCSVTHVYSEFIAITCDSEKFLAVFVGLGGTGQKNGHILKNSLLPFFWMSF